MKKRVLLFVISLIVLFTIPTTIFAQDYFFEVPEQEIEVYIQSNGTLTIEYYYLFQNGAGAHEIDFVDIGMPATSKYSLSNVTATIDNQPITVIEDSPYVDGIALGLGVNAIPAGSSGIVFMRVESVENQFYFASTDEEEEYASMRFQPNYFESNFVGGSSKTTVNIHLPEGVTEQEPRWFTPTNWSGAEEPFAGFDSNNRIIYQWSDENASASKKYEFGVSFPARYIPVDTINTEQTITYNPSDVLGTVIPIACCGGFAGIFALVIYFAAKSAKKRKLKYLPPKIAIEGHGIKRGLTSVEAAVLLEEPMDKILSMILFSVLKKGAAEVESREPLKIKVEEKLPEDLREYETEFLNAFKVPSSSTRRKKLQEMMVALVKSISTKMKGFSRKETIQYYQTIIEKAWKQVEEAETPEVRAERYSEAVDWTMLDKDYDGRTQRTFGSGPVFMPHWWWRADPTIGRTSTASTGRVASGSATRGSAPTPPSGGKSKTITLPRLPGADAAASVTNTVTAMSAGAVGNLASFTSGVTNKTNPIPKSSSSTFRSTGSRGGSSGGSSCVCACACACAGCACACAGGGR